MIPKRIIRTFSSRYLLNDQMRSCDEQLRSIMSDYEQLFFSDSDCDAFMSTHYSWLLDVYHAYPKGVQRSDMFRIAAIHHFGGFYLDLDVFVFERFDPLSDHSLVFPNEWRMDEAQFAERYGHRPRSQRDLDQLGNYAFGAQSSHWFMERLLLSMVEVFGFWFPSSLDSSAVLGSTGPDLLNWTYRRFRQRLGSNITILPGEAAPRTPVAPWAPDHPEWYQFGSYGNHLMTGVWRDNQPQATGSSRILGVRQTRSSIT